MSAVDRIREELNIPDPRPTIELWTDEAEALCDVADAARGMVRAEVDHQELWGPRGSRRGPMGYCDECGESWPCPATRVRAALARLDGGEGR